MQQVLQNENRINAVIIQEERGNNIFDRIIDRLTTCRMVVIFGTHDYGDKGTVNFSTNEELDFILMEKIPFYLIKMCDKFVSRTRFRLPDGINYRRLAVGEPLPPDLVHEVVNKYDSLRESP